MKQKNISITKLVELHNRTKKHLKVKVDASGRLVNAPKEKKPFDIIEEIALETSCISR